MGSEILEEKKRIREVKKKRKKKIKNHLEKERKKKSARDIRILKVILLRNEVVYRHSTPPLLLELIFPIVEKNEGSFWEKEMGFLIIRKTLTTPIHRHNPRSPGGSFMVQKLAIASLTPVF